jgi:hypothetical protein
LQTALETEMKLAISALLEDTTGQQQIQQIEATIALELQKKGFLQRNTEGIVRSRVEISYSPRFIGRGNNLTAAPVSLQTRRYI